MDRTYNLNEVALMTGFTTRTLRNYLNQGLLKGEKVDGIWQFSAEELDGFWRIKRSSAVFDFMSDLNKKSGRSCVILDLPVSVKEGNEISNFFCDQMQDARDAVFNFGWNNGVARVILTGDEAQVADIMKAYYSR